MRAELGDISGSGSIDWMLLEPHMIQAIHTDNRQTMAGGSARVTRQSVYTFECLAFEEQIIQLPVGENRRKFINFYRILPIHTQARQIHCRKNSLPRALRTRSYRTIVTLPSSSMEDLNFYTLSASLNQQTTLHVEPTHGFSILTDKQTRVCRTQSQETATYIQFSPRSTPTVPVVPMRYINLHLR